MISGMNLICYGAARCAFHRDGAPITDKCPGLCDQGKCKGEGLFELDGRLLCLDHALAEVQDRHERLRINTTTNAPKETP